SAVVTAEWRDPHDGARHAAGHEGGARLGRLRGDAQTFRTPRSRTLATEGLRLERLRSEHAPIEPPVFSPVATTYTAATGDVGRSHATPWLSWFLGTAVLSAVVAAALHLSEGQAFVRLAERA